jgi:DNA-binding LacI/PurR family transcriptional regulator
VRQNGDNGMETSGIKVNHKISARDVAKLASVSQSTVSRVLNKTKSDFISKATKEKVLKAARQLGYTPNPIARALRGMQSHLLGLIVRESSDPFFSRFISELSTQARQLGYHIVLGNAHSDPQEALEITGVLDTRHTDGIFILGDLQKDETALEEMLRSNPATIALCRGPSPTSLYTINVDNFAGTQMLLDHLISLGHRRLGFIDGGWLGDIRERREAFQEYIHSNSLPFHSEWIQSEKNSPEGGYRAMQSLLDLSDYPTAIFASDDVMAIGAMKAIADHGKSIPGEISVVGFDNIDFSKYFNPALTTIHQPVEEMCRQALRLMLKLIKEPGCCPSPMLFRLKPELVIRQSTGPVPAEK